MTRTLSPNQLQKEGQAAYQRGDYLAAAGAFQSAAESFGIQGEPLAEAEMRNNRSVALLKAGEAAAALEAVTGTEAVFAASADVRRQAMAIGNVAAALEALGRLEEAASNYEKCADLLKEVGEEQLRATVMQSLSAVQLRLGRQLDALATMYSGLEGLKHPNPKQRMVKKLLQAPFKFK
jgi:tetratricopeptide (TPR) repeat protein